jgi:Ni/Fe-hydrogenase subunit HybB-like protein
MKPGSFRITFWRVVFLFLIAAGAVATCIRFVYGLGAATNLNDRFPWGVWIGFDILCGVGLAAGGFTLVAVVHIFNIEKYRPILRPTVLTAFLGYVLVVCALLFDLGQPHRIWHAMVMWNPHSVMFEVAWCVMLYTTVLALEFSPAVFEKLGWKHAERAFRIISVPLVILGVILSTLHQSSLGSLYLIVPHKLYPLWYSPILPVLFYVSAICVGLSMIIFESWHSSRALNRAMHHALVARIAQINGVCLAVYFVIRYLDLRHRDALSLVLVPRTETYLFWLEIGLMFAGMTLMFQQRVRQSPAWLYASSVLVIFGFVANRLNVSLTGMEASSGVHYIPKWSEIAVTLMIIAIGFAAFRLAAKHLPVFEPEEQEPERATEPAAEPAEQMEDYAVASH